MPSVERFPFGLPSFSMRDRLVPAVLLLLIVVLLASAVHREQQQSDFCQLCGTERTQTSWGLRGTALRLFATHGVAETPISALLTTKHLIEKHQHQWLAPRSVPDPLDEFGPPVTQSLDFINAPRVVGFMRNLADYGDTSSITHWRDLLLRPEYSYVIDGALRFFRMPPNGFSNHDEFMAWWSENGFLLYNRLLERTEAD